MGNGRTLQAKARANQAGHLLWYAETGELSTAGNVLYGSNQRLNFPKRLFALTHDNRHIASQTITLLQPGSLIEHRCKESASL